MEISFYSYLYSEKEKNPADEFYQVIPAYCDLGYPSEETLMSNISLLGSKINGNNLNLT